MNVTPTGGIAAAWSAAKPNANDQAARLANAQGQRKSATAAEEAPAEPKKGPPPAEGQGTRVDVRV